MCVAQSIADSRYQSNMNEIEKSEHKSSEEGSKGFDWTPEVTVPNGCEYFPGCMWMDGWICPSH